LLLLVVQALAPAGSISGAITCCSTVVAVCTGGGAFLLRTGVIAGDDGHIGGADCCGCAFLLRLGIGVVVVVVVVVVGNNANANAFFLALVFFRW
jgi:hypothetical protein